MLFSYDVLKIDMQIVTLVSQVNFASQCSVGDTEEGVKAS